MHEIGRRPDAAERCLARRLREAEREADVVAHGHVRIERVGLEDDADVAVLGLDLVHEVAVEPELAPARQVDAGEHEEARRFSTARRPEQRHEFPVLDRQGHLGDDHGIAEALHDVAELDPRHRRQPFTPPIDICIRYRCAAT